MSRVEGLSTGNQLFVIRDWICRTYLTEVQIVHSKVGREILCKSLGAFLLQGLADASSSFSLDHSLDLVEEGHRLSGGQGSEKERSVGEVGLCRVRGCSWTRAQKEMRVVENTM